MRIWVDGQCFQTGSNVRGIGRYVTDFLHALSLQNPDIQLIISLNGRMKRQAVDARQFLEGVLPDARIEIWYGITPGGEFHRGYCTERRTDERILAQHVNDIAPDIALSPSPFEGSVDASVPFITPDLVDALTACIYHDAIPYRYPDVYLREENARKLYMRRFDEIGNFDLVLCNSEFTQSEYLDIYGKQNSVAIGAGLSESFVQLVDAWQPNPRSMGAQLGTYALYVGGMDWRKNVPFLVSGLSRVPEVMRGELKLVLAGDNGDELIAPIRAMWAEKGLPPGGLVSTGWISDAELVDLYKHATVTLQPSLMEGFGLTALESWACGTPFLSAPGGAVAEVVGRTEFLFDPLVPPALADLVSRTLNDAQFRENLVSHGEQRLGAFTWYRTAETAFNAMRATMEQAGRVPTAPVLIPPVAPSDKRLVMDVSSTAQSPVLSGIQRVMYRLSDAMLDLNAGDKEKTVLSYCRDEDGWYELENLSKEALKLSPTNRLAMEPNDSYLLLDSSWTFIDGQRSRLLDALMTGQEVVNGIHDVGPLTMSAMTDAGMPSAFRRWFEFILEHSTGIVCVSRAVADEIHEVLEAIKYPRPMKLGYFPLGADFAEVPADATGMEVFQQRPSFLMVGTIEPRKGHLVAIRAFEQLWAEGHDVNLVIVGKAGWDTEMIVQLLENHTEARQRLHWIKSASDANLRHAYEQAEALIMASHLEGFGLPVVEAGRFGTPVILSDLPVFREVGEGAPWSSFFERSNPTDLAAKVAEFLRERPSIERLPKSIWPNWSSSAEYLKSVLFDNCWYKTYEPTVRVPNASSVATSLARMSKPLTEPADRAHSLRVVEGPFLSDQGQLLRIVVAVRNNSSHILCSRGTSDGRYAVNLGYHLYHRDGTCTSFDNPRTEIPFLLLPGQEIFLPVRIPIETLLTGVTEVGIDLVQEGVTWFNNEIRVGLLQPNDALEAVRSSASLAKLEDPERDLAFFICRAPSGADAGLEHYYYLSILNRSNRVISLSAEGGGSALTVGHLDGDDFETNGTWVVQCPGAMAPNNFAFLCVFVSKNYLAERSHLSLRLETNTEYLFWNLNFVTQTCNFIRKVVHDRVGAVSTELECIEHEGPIVHDEPEKRHALAVVGGELNKVTRLKIQLTRSAERQPVLRGFNEVEETHTWMQGAHGEIQFDGKDSLRFLASKIEIFCMTFKNADSPLRLTLSIGGSRTAEKYISNEGFMYYSFDLSKEMARELRRTSLIALETDKSFAPQGDERELSIAISSIELVE